MRDRLLLELTIIWGSLLIATTTASMADQTGRMAQAVVDAMCAREMEAWTEAETVDPAVAAPAYDHHYTQCLYEFGEGGRWFSLRYDRSLQVPRRFAWRLEHRSLSVLVIETDAADAQSASPLATYVMDDRGARGRAIFGVIGTFGGLDRSEHFYEPPSPNLGDEECVAEACAPVGTQYAEDWQRRYQDALSRAHARLGPTISNVIKTKETP